MSKKPGSLWKEVFDKHEPTEEEKKHKILYKLNEFNFNLFDPKTKSNTHAIHLRKRIYFVDILEVNEHMCKMKIYMPDGNDVVGWQRVDFISLHFVENPFDGRYNRK